MSITLILPPDKQSALERLAAASGSDVLTVILEAVEDKLNDRTGGEVELPYPQWHEEFQAWIASRRSRNPHFDDSRESMYD